MFKKKRRAQFWSKSNNNIIMVFCHRPRIKKAKEMSYQVKAVWAISLLEILVKIALQEKKKGPVVKWSDTVRHRVIETKSSQVQKTEIKVKIEWDANRKTEQQTKRVRRKTGDELNNYLFPSIKRSLGSFHAKALSQQRQNWQRKRPRALSTKI